MWVDDAIAFAVLLKSVSNTKSSRTIEEIELAFSNVESSKKLSAYQQLAFMKLTDFRLAEYNALKSLYFPILTELGEDKDHDMQVVLDILEKIISPETIDDAIITVESIIESNFLSDEAHVLAHVVHVYSRNYKRSAPQTLNAIRQARNAYALSQKSSFASLALENATAYTSLNVQDYAQSNEHYRAAYKLTQESDYLYFNIDNSLSNLTWMLRQTNELEHAIEINGWQISSLSEKSNKNYVFFVYFACGIYKQIEADYNGSLECFLTAETLLKYALERREQWYAGTIMSSILADKIELATKYHAEFINEYLPKNNLGPLSKLRLAQAYLDIENGKTREAISALNNYHVNNANRQLDSFRKLSMEYNTYINTEIEALEKNVNLQKRLLRHQTMLSGVGVAIIFCFVVFIIFLLNSRKKQRILSTHDSLTGMYNRRGFLEAFGKKIDKTKREGSFLALGMIDIDRFKAINEVNGQAIGDKVLSTIALRLKKVLGDDLVAGRMGGDEFAFILTNPRNKKQSREDLEKTGVALCESLSKDIRVAEFIVKPSVSIGFSMLNDTSANPQQLFDCADFALQSSKQFKRGSARVFSPIDQSSLDARRKVDVALASAHDDEFTLQYQAIVDAHSGQVKGFEALARWHSPELGFISPADFIPLAERTGFINKLSRLLLARALQEASEWPEHLTLSFNLSSQDVNSLENAEKIKQIVLASTFPSSRLIAEMTETAIIQDTSTTKAALSLLTDIGVSVALDDFGTGYSSINHLLDFEFERIKLDRVLIDSIEEDRNKFEIVQTLVDLCHNLKIDCVIEGVETQSQKEQLLKMKVDKFQGYLFSRPIAPQEIPAFLESKN